MDPYPVLIAVLRAADDGRVSRSAGQGAEQTSLRAQQSLVSPTAVRSSLGARNHGFQRELFLFSRSLSCAEDGEPMLL
eukprot:1327843-Rhodomonas_salina.1